MNFRAILLRAAGFLLVAAGIAFAANLNSSGRCVSGTSCNIGEATTTGVTLTTSGASVNIEGTTADTLTVTAAGTNTANFVGADAGGASNTRFDTTSGGNIFLGSTDVNDIDIVTNGEVNVGASQTNQVNIITDDGTVVIDGYVQGQVLVVSSASGALTMNAINLATAGATDHDVPDATCAVAADIGNWFTVVVEDASTVVEIQPLDTSNILIVEGLAQSAGEEVDSCTSGTENEGCSITFTCLAADQWYATAQSGTWAVGGAAD